MSEKSLPKPTESELEILQVLWENGESSVRFVNERLNNAGGVANDRREIGYTTTLKLMQIMHEKKGLLRRNTDARSHLFEAVLPKEETQRNLLDTFVGNVFGGSAMNLVMQALGNHSASKAELDEIKALIQKIENG